MSKLLAKRDSYYVAAFFFIVLALLVYTFFTPNNYSQPEPVTFEIKRGETINSMIDSLYEHGIIPGRVNMRAVGFILGGGRTIKAGRYLIPNGLSYIELLELFILGKREVPLLIDIYPGITIFEAAHQLQEKINLDSAGVIRLCHDKIFMNKLGISAPSLEGYLIPGSYYFYRNTPAKEIFQKINIEFNKFFTDSLKQRARNVRLSATEVLTIASIIEGESTKPDEYSTIAGVYYNRLNKGMKLQADPTVQYARMGKWKRLYNSDLDINSPYNTYMNFGLPPGPINNPCRAAIVAALYPAHHEYIYFVADGSGGHKFSSTYNQHLKLVNQYRQWLKKQTSR
ncbi:MAG: endolytic transglycosylase MltG [Ignavibacteria bacterium]